MPALATAQRPVWLSLRRPRGRQRPASALPKPSSLRSPVSTASLSRRSRRLRIWTLPCISCLCLAAAGPAAAVEATFADEAMATWLEERPRPAASFDINTTIVPNLGDPAPASALYRSSPGSVAFNATQHMDITRWLTPDSPSRFGLTLGVSAPAANFSAPGALANSIAGSSPQPTLQLDLGVRWRSQLQRGRHLDVSAWAQTPDAMGLIWQTQPPTYGTRVEVQWASSRTRGLMPEFGAIGVQLQGGSRLVLRARKGGPMVYYRAKF